MLYLVGLGLYDEKDVTIKGLEAIKASKRVYLEAYTSILGVEKEKLVRKKRVYMTRKRKLK
jgi:diphthine synthase